MGTVQSLIHVEGRRPQFWGNNRYLARLGVVFSFIASFVLVVAVATGNDVARATSALTWTGTSTVSNLVGTDVEFGNGKFVLVGGQDPNKTGEVGGVRVSSNGTTWTTPGTPPPDRDWKFAAYGNNTWVIAAYGLSTGYIATSTDDGSTWTETNISSSITRITFLEFVNGRFMLGGLSVSTFYKDIFSSTNGSAWTSTNFVSCYNQNGGCDNASFMDEPNGVAYHNGRYVVTAVRSMATSTDLATWSSITVPQNFFGNSITVNNGKYLVHDQWSADVLTSTNGTTFASSAASDRVGRTKVFGSEWFALDVSGFSSKLYRSTDGITWTMSFMDNDPDSDPSTDSIQDRFIGLASSGTDVVAASEGPFSPVGARTVKTTLPPAISPATQTVTGTGGTAITASAPLVGSFFQGAVSYAVSSGTLPTGLSLNSATGVISGTPSSASTATITITGSGATFGTATATITFAIAAAPTTTTTTTTTVPSASNIASAPTLVTGANQAALEANPGSAVAIINGQPVAVETVKVQENASAADQQAVAKEIVAEITKLLPAGATNSIKVVNTTEGAELSGLMVNPEDPNEKLNVPVDSVTLVKAGNAAVLISALNQTNLPAEVTGGVIEVTRGGIVSARAYGLPGSQSGEIVLMSTPRLLKTFTVAADGSYNGQVPLPTDIAFGSHTVVMATANAKVSLGINLVRTKMQFRIKRTISTKIFKNRAGVKKAGGKVTISGAGRCKASLTKVKMSAKAGPCYVTVKQAAKGKYPAVNYRFTVQVVKKLIKKKK